MFCALLAFAPTTLVQAGDRPRVCLLLQCRLQSCSHVCVGDS